tara:strand:+ start:26 stop:154 length:129 start_codon:yes stop_codon:yes gene_type:complete
VVADDPPLAHGVAAAEEAGLLGASEERIPLFGGGFTFGVWRA